MKVREAIEKLLRHDMDAELMIHVRLEDKLADDMQEAEVPVGDVRTENGNRRRILLDCPICLEIQTSIGLKEEM